MKREIVKKELYEPFECSCGSFSVSYVLAVTSVSIYSVVTIMCMVAIKSFSGTYARILSVITQYCQ